MNRPGLPKSRGLWVAFFGPDGVGKSAAIEQLRVHLGPAFAGVSQHHFRPMFGRSQRDRAPVTDPHGHPARGLLFSLGKLVYWLMDCWCGYLFGVQPALRRSQLVIFDRYLPDVVVDPRRYRLPASAMSFARWLTKLAPRPGLNVLLDAPSEAVQRRKTEVSKAESQRQRVAYLAMFQHLPDRLIVNANCPVDEVEQRVSAAILTLVTTRQSEQSKSLAIADL